MPIFDDIIPLDQVWPVDAYWPRRRAEALLERFILKYPHIHYDLYWDTRLMNAQAYFGANGRSVRLYGGLGRHRKVGVPGLAFALAHETGHHLAGAPHHPHFKCISSEERADEWAETTGLPHVFGDKTGRRYADEGLRELSAVWKKFLGEQPRMAAVALS